MAKYYLPSFGGHVELDDGNQSPYQASPLLNSYSPRLFGSPPQLTNLNDMRLMSAIETDDHAGPVGDFYVSKILRDAPIVNFCIGRALFIGGKTTLLGTLQMVAQYGTAINRYNLFGEQKETLSDQQQISAKIRTETTVDEMQKALSAEETNSEYVDASSLGISLDTDLDADTELLDFASMGNATELLNDVAETAGDKAKAGLYAALLTSLSAQQPYYTFESDWFTYINNVKMMINTAVIMLGLQSACVKIGDYYYPIGMNPKAQENGGDIWSKYRFITPDKGDGDGVITGIDTQNGDTTQYVSFMISNPQIQESYSNEYGAGFIQGIVTQGDQYGAEIAFLTNSTPNRIDDGVMNIASKAVNLAEDVVTNLSLGIGKFTAAIVGSMTKSYIGDHAIYPDVFQKSSSTTSLSFSIHLSCDGDPYSYLTQILVPLFFILGMTLPKLSKNNASAYQYPPIVQCNIPGMWGSRLAAIESVSITKNQSGKEVSINGYPLEVDVSVTVKDLQHVLVTSPMNQPGIFLNNTTMFDYIAQISGVDKYRVNGSMRLISRLALAASAASNIFTNIGEGFINDWVSIANRMSGVYRL